VQEQRQSVIFFSAVLLIVVLITGLMRHYFHDSPPASFADLYLVAVLVLAYRYSWKPAAALAGVSLLLGVYLLLPLDGPDRFELGSYAVCAVLVVWVAASLQRPGARRGTDNHTPVVSDALHSQSEGKCPNTTPEFVPAPRS
jgi:hypothetical protein